MNLFSALFAIVWTVAAYGIAMSGWRQARKWCADGVIDNGVGVRIRRDERPVAFALAYRGAQAISLFGFAFFLPAGVVATFICIVRLI
ncbi:hypothetical protein GTZ99_04390 [Novosphingobium sp. FSY-8]|uniref:Uncharacterized protein n=1 Tax=Novosphingobium ovatum TaxID=1908523 RepID=A0ABW9XB92_9SPHN|nr:hypothetical protein [Novosphingobium ovatum]